MIAKMATINIKRQPAFVISLCKKFYSILTAYSMGDAAINYAKNIMLYFKLIELCSFKYCDNALRLK